MENALRIKNVGNTCFANTALHILGDILSYDPHSIQIVMRNEQGQHEVYDVLNNIITNTAQLRTYDHDGMTKLLGTHDDPGTCYRDEIMTRVWNHVGLEKSGRGVINMDSPREAIMNMNNNGWINIPQHIFKIEYEEKNDGCQEKGQLPFYMNTADNNEIPAFTKKTVADPTYGRPGGIISTGKHLLDVLMQRPCEPTLKQKQTHTANLIYADKAYLKSKGSHPWLIDAGWVNSQGVYGEPRKQMVYGHIPLRLHGTNMWLQGAARYTGIHYYYIRRHNDGQWWQYNDSSTPKVYSVDELEKELSRCSIFLYVPDERQQQNLGDFEQEYMFRDPKLSDGSYNNEIPEVSKYPELEADEKRNTTRHVRFDSDFDVQHPTSPRNSMSNPQSRNNVTSLPHAAQPRSRVMMLPRVTVRRPTHRNQPVTMLPLVNIRRSTHHTQRVAMLPYVRRSTHHTQRVAMLPYVRRSTQWLPAVSRTVRPRPPLMLWR